MDLSIYDNYTGVERDFDFLTLDRMYRYSDSLLCILCMKGEAEFYINTHKIQIKRKDILFIRPNFPFYINCQSKDFHIDVWRIGKEYLNLGSSRYLHINLEKIIYEKPIHMLSERKARLFHIMHSYLKILLQENNLYKETIILEYLKVLFVEISGIISTSESSEEVPDRAQIISRRFFKLVEQNYCQIHKVGKYAKMMGISSKHLALTTNRTTGKHPSEWIENYIILESKRRLKNSEDSIQLISYDLNFATPSHFTKFFKSKVSMTPREFRKQNY